MNPTHNTPIEAIIFDVGGVLIRTIDHSGRRKWEESLGLPIGEAEYVVLNSEMGHRAQRGEITDDQLWQWVGEHLDLGENLESFRQDFWHGDVLDESLLDLIKRLNGRYQMAIISNATDLLLDTLEHYGLTQEFDLIVGSAYEGIMKPDPSIFTTTLARLGREPSETVFIDDAPANIAGAQSVGMNAIQFVPGIDLAGELSKLGVWVKP